MCHFDRDLNTVTPPYTVSILGFLVICAEAMFVIQANSQGIVIYSYLAKNHGTLPLIWKPQAKGKCFLSLSCHHKGNGKSLFVPTLQTLALWQGIKLGFSECQTPKVKTFNNNYWLNVCNFQWGENVIQVGLTFILKKDLYAWFWFHDKFSYMTQNKIHSVCIV